MNEQKSPRGLFCEVNRNTNGKDEQDIKSHDNQRNQRQKNHLRAAAFRASRKYLKGTNNIPKHSPSSLPKCL